MYAIIVTGLLGMLLLYLGLFKKQSLLMPVGSAGLALMFIFSLSEWNHNHAWFGNMILLDNLSIMFNSGMILLCFLIFLISREYYKDVQLHVAEYYALFVFSLGGAFVMTSYTNLIMLFLGLEIISIPLYILAGSKKKSLRSNEASFKYFLLGSFASTFILLGITLVYGHTASFFLSDMQEFISKNPQLPLSFKTAILFILFGMAFKLALTPFHFWTPDVYEGAPSLVTGYMATIVKLASFAALWKLFSAGIIPVFKSLEIILILLAVLSLLVGNLTALRQQNFKRFIAYSGIGNSGFILILFLCNDPAVGKMIFFYQFVYSLAMLVALYVFYHVKKFSKGGENIDIFQGLWYRNPWLALSLIIALLSFAGIPLFAGFWAKYFVIFQAIQSGQLLLAILAIVLSLVAVYYYLSIIRRIIQKSENDTHLKPDSLSLLSLLILLICVVFLGLFPLALNYV